MDINVQNEQMDKMDNCTFLTNGKSEQMYNKYKPGVKSKDF